MALRSKHLLSVFVAGLMMAAVPFSLSAGDPSSAGVVRIRDGAPPVIRSADSVRSVSGVRPAGHENGTHIYWNAYETTGQKIIYRMTPAPCENCGETGEEFGTGEELDSQNKHRWFHFNWFRKDKDGTGCPDGSCKPHKNHESLPGHIVKHFFPDVRGRGGHGLFGGNCRLNPYESQCEETAWFRHWHARSCRWNRYWYGVYRRDGAGAGKYEIYYPLNLQHFDQRDGKIYAAPEWGIPMAVPLAPNVEHTYNYGWGVPSSRLTRVSAPVPRAVP